MSDVGTTHRGNLSTRRKLAIWERDSGKCWNCQRKLVPGDKPIYEHVRPLGLGGADTDDNIRLSCSPCADVKTHTTDIPAIAKAKRNKARHAGIRKPSTLTHPTLKKRMDGTVVDRRTGAEIR